MSTTPAVIAYVVASLGCSVLTGTFMAAHLPPVMQQPAIQGTLDRVGSAFAARVVDVLSEAQPEPWDTESICGRCECSCAADIEVAITSCRSEVRTRDTELAEAKRGEWFWQCSTYSAIAVTTCYYMWMAYVSRGRRSTRAEQARISTELSALSAISPPRARVSPRRLSGQSIVDLRRLEDRWARHGELLDAGEAENSGSDSDTGAHFDPLPWPEDVA